MTISSGQLMKALFLPGLALLLGLFSVQSQAAGSQQQGYIVSSSHSSKTVEGIRLEKYILRIRLKASGSSPSKIITAEMLVERGSVEEAIIKSAREKHILCGFVMHRRGMRYQVSEIYLLSGQDFSSSGSFGNSSDSTVVYGNGRYYDKADKVLISSRKILKKSASIGNDGISLGN